MKTFRYIIWAKCSVTPHKGQMWLQSWTSQQICERSHSSDLCAFSVTVLDTNEKPTRPPPRKFTLNPKPPVTNSQVTSTTAAASVTMTTRTMMTGAVKTERKSLGKKARKNKEERRKKKKMKPWKKNKARKSKLSDKAKSSQHAVSDLKSQALQTPNSLTHSLTESCSEVIQASEKQHEPSENLHWNKDKLQKCETEQHRTKIREEVSEMCLKTFC